MCEQIRFHFKKKENVISQEKLSKWRLFFTGWRTLLQKIIRKNKNPFGRPYFGWFREYISCHDIRTPGVRIAILSRESSFSNLFLSNFSLNKKWQLMTKCQWVYESKCLIYVSYLQTQILKYCFSKRKRSLNSCQIYKNHKTILYFGYYTLVLLMLKKEKTKLH